MPERVLAFMLDAENEMAKLGIPIKTRHNEVAPAQYEFAPVFENSNVGSDHQQLCMQILQNVARRYQLVCLLHEKPFAGVNGSGKHNNWSFGTDTGVNLLEPGDTPHENLQFLFFCTAVLAAVDSPPGAAARLDRVARPGPPAGRRTRRRRRSSRSSSAPSCRRSTTRSRAARATRPRRRATSSSAPACCRTCRCTAATATAPSPFAFTGNKFEFRALGSSMSCGLPNTVLNTIAAQASTAMSDALEVQLENGAELAEAVLAVVKEGYAAHKRIVFNGDNYTDDWHAEAEQRGLANLPQTPDALPALVSETAVEVMGAYNVLSERELDARYEVFVEQYVAKLNIEAETTFSMAKTMLLPAAIRYLGELGIAGSSKGVEAIRARGRRAGRRVRRADRRARVGQHEPSGGRRPAREPRATSSTRSCRR